MLRRTAISLTLVLLALLALPALGLRGATPSAATKIYLPLAACPGCEGQEPRPTLAPFPTPDTSSYASEGVRLINEARAAVGCPAAVSHPALMQATHDWSAYMDRTADYRHTSNGYYATSPYFYTGALVENIGGGGTPADMVTAWLRSPPHKRNLEFCYRPDNQQYNPNRIYYVGLGLSDGYSTLVIGWSD